MFSEDDVLDQLTHDVAALIEEAHDIALTMEDRYRINDVIDSLVKEFTE